MPFETKILMSILFFLSFLGFMTILLPVGFQVLSPFDFMWFGGGITAVAGACVITTGIPCAVALVVFSVVSLLTYIVVFVSMIKLLIFMPLTIVIIYIVSRMARGGG